MTPAKFISPCPQFPVSPWFMDKGQGRQWDQWKRIFQIGAILITFGPALRAEWVPPIGIPAPEFGIEESHTMYAGQRFDFDGDGTHEAGEEYKDAGNGPFTHYIDVSHPKATDTSNPYGSPEKPRLSIPRDLLPGSVVELHSEPTNRGPSGECRFDGKGTVEKPIFIRGIGATATEKVVITRPVSIGFYAVSQFLIIENIHSRAFGIIAPNNSFTEDVHHIAIRHSEAHGTPDGGGSGIASHTNNFVHDVVLYDSKFMDNGIWDPNQATGDRDYHGIGVGNGVFRLWVVDSELAYNEGDGMQINSNPARASHHIYVGRNISHHNKQTGFGLKYARDVIYSQNIVFGHRPSSSASGGGMGLQYGPERAWYLFNQLYDNEFGFVTGSASGPGFDGDGIHAYYIGNVIHNIHHSSPVWNPVGTPDCIPGSAFCFRGVPIRTVIGNTIYDVDAGISAMSGSAPGVATHMINNIISNVADISYAHHLRIDDRSADRHGIVNSAIDHNLLFQNGNPVKIVTGMNYNAGMDLNNFQQAYPGKCADCVKGNPRFADAANADFHLIEPSPAIDAGESSGLVATVLSDYKTRYGIDISYAADCAVKPQGVRADIGAFEHGAPGECQDLPVIVTPPVDNQEPPPGNDVSELPDTNQRDETASMAWKSFINTFNPARGESLDIQFDIAERSDIELSIYDRRGAEVLILVRGVRHEGLNHAEWNGRNSKGDVVSSGVYTIVLKAGGKTLKKKVVVIK